MLLLMMMMISLPLSYENVANPYFLFFCFLIHIFWMDSDSSVFVQETVVSAHTPAPFLGEGSIKGVRR